MDLDAVGVEIEVAHADATQLGGAASGVEQGQDDGSISKRSRASVGRGRTVFPGMGTSHALSSAAISSFVKVSMTGSETGGGSMVRIMFLGTSSSLTAQDHSEERLV